MSTLANQPVATKPPRPPSARLARFGVPVPPRIAQFFDGPELAAHDGVRAWGFDGWSGDTRLKVKWGSSRLLHIHEYATDGHFEEHAAARYLPIAALGSETHMFAVDVTSESLAVYFFDYESGFKQWAPDFETFLRKLLRKGERTPAEQLAKTYEQASALNADKQYAELIALVEPVVAQFSTQLDAFDDTRDTLGAAWNLLGIAHEKLEDIPRAMTCYETALALGTDSAGLNICDLYLNDFKDYGKLVTYGEQLRANTWAFSDKYAWFHIRNYLGQGYLLTGRPADAVRAYHQILDKLGLEEPAKIQEAITDLRDLIAERREADRATAEGILAWLDVPAPALSEDELAAMRDWWTGLPAKVAGAIREAIHVEGEPSDADLARVAQLTDLDVKHAELKDLSWVTMLDRLVDLDVEGNKLRDLSPLASLVRLERLDVSENKLQSLRPLAPLVRLERLSAGENKLAGLEGLEQMHRLDYLHVNECGLKSLEPLRGLRELEEVTVYSNEITDLAPLAESPRIKQISSFSNPIEHGFAALAALPWLESVDAGDKTPVADVEALRAANPLVRIDHFYRDDEDRDAAEPAEPEQAPELPALRRWWNELSEAWRGALDKELDGDQRGKRDPSDEALLELVRQDSLHLDDRPLQDLEPLARFTRLDYLNVGNTGTTDLTPIASLPRLRDLLCRTNPLSSLAPLAAARALEELYLETCRVATLAGLERCFTLRELYAEDNVLEELGPLGELDQLRVLDLAGNRITSIAPLAKLPRLRRLMLGGNRVTDLAPLASCRELRVLEIWANPGVRNGVALGELPELARVISHGSLPRPEIDELRRRRPDIVID